MLGDSGSVSLCVWPFSPDMTANYGVQNNEKETATRPADSPVHTHIYTLCVGVKRGVTIISLLRALQLKLISDLKEMRRDRARSEEEKKKSKMKSHIHLRLHGGLKEKHSGHLPQT